MLGACFELGSTYARRGTFLVAFCLLGLGIVELKGELAAPSTAEARAMEAAQIARVRAGDGAASTLPTGAPDPAAATARVDERDAFEIGVSVALIIVGCILLLRAYGDL